MKKILIIALLLVFTATSAFATGMFWQGQKGSGRVGLGVSRDGVGFIVFEDDKENHIYIYMDSNFISKTPSAGGTRILYDQMLGGQIAHSICITHAPALYTAHSPETENAWFDLIGSGWPLLWETDRGVPR